jgi:GTP-binding protein Era
MMMGAVHASLEDADLFLLLVDVNERFPEELVIKMAQKSQVPVLLVLNKVDKSTEEKVRQRHEEITSKVKVAGAIGISATHDINLYPLKQMILELLNEGPPYFDPDEISDRPERFFVSELIREAIFLRLKDEVPYSCEVSILQFEEKDNVSVIHAEIHVERQVAKGHHRGQRREDDQGHWDGCAAVDRGIFREKSLFGAARTRGRRLERQQLQAPRFWLSGIIPQEFE